MKSSKWEEFSELPANHTQLIAEGGATGEQQESITILEVLRIPQHSHRPFSNTNSSAARCAKNSVLRPKELYI